MEINGKYFKSYLQREEALQKQYSPDRIKKQHAKGKLTAHERLTLLFDEGSFEEIDTYVTPSDQGVDFGKVDSAYGDGVVAGHGKIDGRLVFAYAQDFTIMGGSLGIVHARKIVKIQEMALKMGAPIIGLNDSGGARIQEGIASLSGYAIIFNNIINSSGIIPQISVIMGPAAGGAVYAPALTDWVFMTSHTSYMFVTGPNVVREVLNEEISSEDLGGAEVHATKSGVANMIYDDEENTLIAVRKLLTYLPSNNVENPPLVPDTGNTPEVNEKLRDIVPDDPHKAYDVRDVVNLIVDRNSFFETSELFAANIVTGFGRLAGKTIGIVANQPKVLAGVLDINSSTKGARFIRFCDAFNIPLLTLEDVPGFLPGTDQEWNGIITNGAKLLYALSEATVPRVTVITRKAYGGAYDVMNSKHIGADMNFAWPTAEIAVMGAKGASEIIFKKEISEAADPAKKLLEKEAEYAEKFATPYLAAERGFIDEVIEPKETRKKLIKAFAMLENKVAKRPRKKHGNIPL